MFWPRHVLSACLMLFTVVFAGGIALWVLTNGDYSLWQNIYFALITVSTVGFGEPPELDRYPGTHAVVAVMIISGVAALAFFESALTAMLVEGTLGKAFRRRRMEKKLEGIRDHIVVAGCGRTGKYCVEELAALGKPFVIVDRNAELLERLSDQNYDGRLIYVAGDATDDHALQAAGIERAWGLVSALTEDRDNVFVVLSSRTLNPNLKIVSKMLETENEPKLLKAGADKLVCPHQIGGFRLVSELIRPRTMEFLDGMQAMSKSSLHMEDVELVDGSPLIGETVVTSHIRARTNALVVGIREPDGAFIYNPHAGHELRVGCHLIVAGDHDAIVALREIAEPHTVRAG